MNALFEFLKEESASTIIAAIVSAIVSFSISAINNRYKIRIKRSEDHKSGIADIRAAFHKYLSAAEQYVYSCAVPETQAFNEIKSAVLIYAPLKLHNAIFEINEYIPNIHSASRGFIRSDVSEAELKIRNLASEFAAYLNELETKKL